MFVNYHYRKAHKTYRKLNKTTKQRGICTFCDPANQPNIIYETDHSFILPNRTPYNIWELHNVIDHLLVMPKRHVHSLSELDEVELADIMKILAKYEGDGYNVYARAKGSIRRSVYHQHTHLIKIDPKEPRISFFMRKPWLLIKF